jgi:hypothetical protein
MEHSRANRVGPLLTPFRDAGLLPFGVAGETRLADQKTLERPEAKADEALGAYLDLLNQDIKRGGEFLADFGHDLFDRLAKLVEDVEIDVENDVLGDNTEI